MTACGSCDNCGFLLLLNVLLNVSVRKQAYRRRRGQQGGGGECGKQGRRLGGGQLIAGRRGSGRGQVSTRCRIYAGPRPTEFPHRGFYFTL